MSSPLRILADFRWMIPEQSGGLEIAAYNFMERLLARNEVLSGAVALTLIVPWELSDRFRAVAPANVALICLDSPANDAMRLIRALSGGRYGTSVRSGDYDVTYSMTGRVVLETLTIPSLVMVPDLQHLVYPHYFDATSRDRRTLASRAVAVRARHIVTISEFSRQEIVRLLGVDASRVSCSYLSVDHLFDQPPSTRQRREVLTRYDLEQGRYLLLPAHIWAHKNHERVVTSLETLAARGCEVPMLVSTGANSSPFARQLMARVSGGPLSNRVRFLGLCPQHDLPSLYSSAEALVFCSLYEGFGMPLLEAMRMGCPVIASNTTSIPEVAGDAAVLVDPTDANAIAAAIERLRQEPGLRDRLVAAGQSRAAGFSWDRHCDEVLALLFRCCGRTAPEEASLGRRVDLRNIQIQPPLASWFRTEAYSRLRRFLIAGLPSAVHRSEK